MINNIYLLEISCGAKIIDKFVTMNRELSIFRAANLLSKEPDNYYVSVKQVYFTSIGDLTPKYRKNRFAYFEYCKIDTRNKEQKEIYKELMEKLIK